MKTQGDKSNNAKATIKQISSHVKWLQQVVGTNMLFARVKYSGDSLLTSSRRRTPLQPKIVVIVNKNRNICVGAFFFDDTGRECICMTEASSLVSGELDPKSGCNSNSSGYVGSDFIDVGLLSNDFWNLGSLSEDPNEDGEEYIAFLYG